MDMVQRRFEAGRYRYVLEGTSVYRTGLKGEACQCSYNTELVMPIS